MAMTQKTAIPTDTTLHFLDNFESATLGNWNETSVVGSSTIGAAASTDMVGAYILKASVGDNGVSKAIAVKTGLSLTSFWTRFTLRFSTNALIESETIQILGLRKSDNSNTVLIKLKEVSSLYRVGATVGATTEWGTTDLNLDQNYRIELRYIKDTSLQVWVEGVLQVTISTGLDDTIGRVFLGLVCDSQRTSISYFDEIYVLNRRLGPITRTLFMDDSRAISKSSISNPYSSNRKTRLTTV